MAFYSKVVYSSFVSSFHDLHHDIYSGDQSTISESENFIASGEIMRKESLSHASVPCSPPKYEFDEDEYYRVESTGALVTIATSITLLHFYCSRLPSDGLVINSSNVNIYG